MSPHLDQTLQARVQTPCAEQRKGKITQTYPTVSSVPGSTGTSGIRVNKTDQVSRSECAKVRGGRGCGMKTGDKQADGWLQGLIHIL